MVLAGGPSVLLLDEPAGLGPEEAPRWSPSCCALKGRRSILLVEHDMDAVWALADRVSVLVGGKGWPAASPDAVRRDPEARRAYLGEVAALMLAAEGLCAGYGQSPGVFDHGRWRSRRARSSR